ncbi:hypothetical protein Q5P01_012051 [Channa striata]|uniref:T-complex 11, testis-specific-like 1 n=1 Tax=Channa striata TaxID=64152 RepID=A0AA88SJU7_CHASR|nr:hypothetical protein Q5P01_012051 [Channa striata]
MPKEGDHLRDGEDRESKEEGAQEASEEMVRKRVRANTPSPHRGNTPQASPPRFVSVEELMETAKGVTNMALAHEIMVNQAFQVKPQELPEGSLERRVKEIMHKAFWDCLEAQLKEDPPSYGHAIKLLAEIKETLLSFLLPGHGRLRSHIEEVLDLPLIQQQAENGALDISRLSQFIVGMMGSLCAPCRDEDISKLKEITEIVPLLKAIFSVMDLMKVDMANFALSSIRPHLMQQSVEYERNKFQGFLEKQPNALDYTKKWLEDTVKYVREAGVDGSSAASSDPVSLLPHNVHNHAYLRLLKWDHASDPFPETVLMDQVRFQEMQQEADRLVLLSSLLLIVYTATGEAISGLPGLMETLKNTVNVMLADMHAPSFNAQEALATIGEKLCVELSQCLSQHGYSPFSADRKNTLKGQILATTQPDNTVRKLMDSRVQAYLLASLESSQHNTAPPLPGGLAPVSRELKELAVRFSRLINFNKLVFSPFYQRILQKLVTSGESPDTEIWQQQQQRQQQHRCKIRLLCGSSLLACSLTLWEIRFSGLTEGMASQVLVYPSHLHSAETSALGTSTSGTSRHTKEAHHSNNTSRAFQHRPPTKTYVIGVNYGIAYPNNVIPSSVIAESKRQYRGVQLEEREQWALQDAGVQREERWEWQREGPAGIHNPVSFYRCKGPQEVRPQKDGGGSPSRGALDSGLLRGACITVQEEEGRNRRVQTRGRYVNLLDTGATQRCEHKAGGK